MRAIELSPAVIVGTGLVGASVGCALTAAGIDVHLFDAVASHATVAASLGAGTTEPVEAADVRLVVVAVPPAYLADEVASALKKYPHATVTDVGSVKGTIINALRTRKASGLKRYCGGHPMAGSHHTGPMTARADLFVDRTWVVAPHDTASAATVLDVQELARTCGARVVTLGPAHHDAVPAHPQPVERRDAPAGQLDIAPASVTRDQRHRAELVDHDVDERGARGVDVTGGRSGCRIHPRLDETAVRGIHLAAHAVDENAEQVGPAAQRADRVEVGGNVGGADSRRPGAESAGGTGSHPSSLRARYDGLISTDPAITGELAEERPGKPRGH